MYGLPKDINLDFFVGRTLLQICIGASDIILKFDESVSLTITCSIGFKEEGCDIRKYDFLSHSAVDIIKLLHKIVIGVNGLEDGTLILEYNDGNILEVYDDSEQYESYIIHYGDNEMIIV